MTRISIYLCLTCISLVLGACCDHPRHFYPIDIAGWTYDTPVVVSEVKYEDISQQSIIIGHTEQYRYENIYLRIIQMSQRDTLVDEILSIPLMDQGAWIGKNCCDGYLVAHHVDLHNHLSAIHIYQHSRDEALRGIYAAGLR